MDIGQGHCKFPDKKLALVMRLYNKQPWDVLSALSLVHSIQNNPQFKFTINVNLNESAKYVFFF